MRLIRQTAQFRKALKRVWRSGRFNREALGNVIDALARGEKLAPSFRDHELSGKLVNHHECHIRPDLLLLYRIEDDALVLALVNLGSHSDLFE